MRLAEASGASGASECPAAGHDCACDCAERGGMGVEAVLRAVL